MAAAIARSYGLPAEVIDQRMATGRFRVKSGIDQRTAQLLAADLVKKGAICAIVDESGAVLGRWPQGAAAAVAAAAPRPVAPPVSAPVPAPNPAANFQSGLQAASRDSQADLAALAASMNSLKLATLDGQDDGHLGGPDDNSDEPTRPSASLADFGPPAAEEQPLHLADVSGVVPQAGSAESASAHSHHDPDRESVAFISDSPPPRTAPAPSAPPSRRPSGMALPRPPKTMAPTAAQSLPAGAAPEQPASAPGHRARGGVAVEENAFDRARTRLADAARLRFAVGVFAALLIGFLPALLYAQSGRGDIADKRAALIAEQTRAGADLDAWNLLDTRRSATVAEMESTQQNIFVGGLLIWLVCAGALAFLWFRKIDWQFYQTPPARAPAAHRPAAPARA